MARRIRPDDQPQPQPDIATNFADGMATDDPGDTTLRGTITDGNRRRFPDLREPTRLPGRPIRRPVPEPDAAPVPTPNAPAPEPTVRPDRPIDRLKREDATRLAIARRNYPWIGRAMAQRVCLHRQDFQTPLVGKRGKKRGA